MLRMAATERRKAPKNDSRPGEPFSMVTRSAESDEEVILSDGSNGSYGSQASCERRPNDVVDEASNNFTASDTPRLNTDSGLADGIEMQLHYHDQERRPINPSKLDTKAAATASFVTNDHQPTNEAHGLSLDPNEQTLSYEEELLFLRSESVLKRSRESTEQCKDIIVTLRFFANDQLSVEAEVNGIRDGVQASNSTIKECLIFIEPLRDQKKLAAFINSEVDVMIRGFRVSLNALEDQFGLFDITPMSLHARLKAWDKLCSSFEEQYSCSIVEHLSLCCRFGQELRANLEAGILSSPESTLLRSRVSQISRFTAPGTTSSSPASPTEPDVPQSRRAFRFVRSPSRFTHSPMGLVNDENVADQLDNMQSTRNAGIVKATARKAPENSPRDYGEESDSLEDDDSNSSSEHFSNGSTLADSGSSSLGQINWFWICQADLIPGFVATPWKKLFPEAVCIGAISVLLNVLENFTNSSNCRYVESQDRCTSWIDTGKSSFPGYAHNASGGVVASGIYEDATFACLSRHVPPIELLYSYNHQVDRAYYQSNIHVKDSLGELVGLDSWLSFCSRLPEISDGPSNLLRVLPSLIQRTMTDFDLEFSSLDRTSRDGGLRIIQTIADSLLQSFRDQNLTMAEQLFTIVAIIRTVKFGLCIARGIDTSQLRDILIHDVQVHMA